MNFRTNFRTGSKEWIKFIESNSQPIDFIEPQNELLSFHKDNRKRIVQVLQNIDQRNKDDAEQKKKQEIEEKAKRQELIEKQRRDIFISDLSD